MSTVYKVMVIHNTPYPRLYNTYDNRELASKEMNKLDKRGLFTYINIETIAVDKPKLQLIKQETGYNRLFRR